MKNLYKEQNTFRILPIHFMKNLGILLKYDNFEEVVFPIIEAYYNWAMGHSITVEDGEYVHKALVLLGDKMNIRDYDARLEVWKKNNGK